MYAQSFGMKSFHLVLEVVFCRRYNLALIIILLQHSYYKDHHTPITAFLTSVECLSAWIAVYI